MIHNKEYLTVAERLGTFHRDHPKGSITTEVISNANGVTVMKATITFDGQTFIGHASEKEGSTMINKTSALENAETSAVGRALAFAGYAGSEIASADEVANAIKQQNTGHSVEKKPIVEAPANAPSTTTVRYITEKQQKRLYAITKEAVVAPEIVKGYLKEKYNIEHSSQITVDIYDAVVAWVEDYGAKNMPEGDDRDFTG